MRIYAIIILLQSLIIIGVSLLYFHAQIREYLRGNGWERKEEIFGYEYAAVYWMKDDSKKQFSLLDAFRRQRALDKMNRLDLPSDETPTPIAGRWRDDLNVPM